MSSTQRPTLEAIVALCKRRGFVYPSAEIYGGLNGVYDFGHLGTLMKQNIKQAWTNSLFATHKDILLFDGAILGHQETWKASGHVDGFKDPMIDCTNCKHRYRADDIDIQKSCPHCGKKAWTEVRQFNMMFQTQLGAAEDKSSVSYLRPETAQAIFINFKQVCTTNRVKIPFGIAQIGKAFRNEITPKQFLFRVREFEQMELEWFCKPIEASVDFNYWVDNRYAFLLSLGINKDNLRKHIQTTEERAHYAANTTDIEYQFPFGWKELEGIANRTDYDLKQHIEHSHKDLQVYDDETKKSYIPYVIESSIGVDRLFLTLLFDAYKEEKINDEERVVLSLSPKIAPIKAAFFPLSKKLNQPMLKIYRQAQKLGYMLEFDDAGSIGKRYRRQDEIGTPVCFTYDFESEQDNCVTVRDRDTTKQKRMPIDQIHSYLTELMNNGK